MSNPWNLHSSVRIPSATDLLKVKTNDPSIDVKGASQKSQTQTNSTKSDDASNPKKPASDRKVFEPGVNVLNKYRSVTYNFTLAGLRQEEVNTPEVYRKSELDLTIIKSGGKGNYKISNSVSGVVRNTVNTTTNKITSQIDMSGADLVDSFNKNAPGRFDMFIDNIEIDSIMTASNESNLSLATGIRFEVFEPYSVTGFIETLSVVAVAAGYTNYAQASFILKMECKGYPNDATFPEPVIIPNTTRYFPFGFTGVEMEVTEKGTRYKCAGVPFNEKAFGQVNEVKKDITTRGITLKEVFKNFENALNDLQKEMDNSAKENPTGHDEYKIKFQKWDNEKGFIDDDKSPLALANITIPLKENSSESLPDAQTTNVRTGYQNTPSSDNSAAIKNAEALVRAAATNLVSANQNNASPEQMTDLQDKLNTAQSKLEAARVSKTSSSPTDDRYTPNTPETIPVNKGSKIHEVISSVVRDSTYCRDLIKNIAKTVDSYGMVDYFLIRTKVENQVLIDEQTKRPYQIYTYIVSPYKVHYTRVPNYRDHLKDLSKLQNIVARKYEYIYTGQNVDIINFKLNFNNLYFEAIPAGMANTDSVGSTDAAAKENTLRYKRSATNPNEYKKSTMVSSTLPNAALGEVNAENGPNAGQLQDDPYFILSRAMHNAIINAKASMVTCELDMLGDPYFVVTGGIGNYDPKPAGHGETINGEAFHNYGEVLINLSFRNPIDIDTFENGGSAKFMDANVKPKFAGIYMVTQVTSTFKDGQFKQRLQLIRMPGEIGNDISKGSIENKVATEQKVEDQSVADVAKVDTTTPTPFKSAPLFSVVADPLVESLISTKNNFPNPLKSIQSAATSLQTTIGAVQTTVQSTVQVVKSNSPLTKLNVKGS